MATPPPITVFFLLLRDQGEGDGDGPQPQPYSQRPVRFAEQPGENGQNVPMWVIAKRNTNGDFESMAFDGVSWLPEGPVVPGNEARSSIFMQDDVRPAQNGLLKLSSAQCDLAFLRARLCLSKKVVLFHPAKGAAALCTVISALPMRFRPVGATDESSDIPLVQKNVLLLGVPDGIASLDDLTPEEQSSVASAVASLRAPTSIRMEAITQGQAPPALPPAAAPHLAAIPVPHPHAPAPFVPPPRRCIGVGPVPSTPGQDRSDRVRAASNKGRRVTYKYASAGSEYTQRGVYISDTQVRWDTDHSVTDYPPRWAGCTEISSYVAPIGGDGDDDSDDGAPPTDGHEHEFDVFNDVTWLAPLFTSGADAVIRMARDELRADPNATGPLVMTVGLKQAESALRRFLSANLDRLDPDDLKSQVFSDFRLAHELFIQQWAASQHLDGEAINSFIRSKRDDKRNIVRQAIEKHGKRGERGARGGRVSRGFGAYTGRAGYGNRYRGVGATRPRRGYTGCLICSSPEHYAKQCPFNPAPTPTPAPTPAPAWSAAPAGPRGSGPGFRGGRGGPRT